MRKRSSRERGLTAIEALVSTAILAMALIVATSIVARHVRLAEIRVAADQLVVNLHKSRLTAVTHRRTAKIAFVDEPSVGYAITDSYGNAEFVAIPTGIRLTSSDTEIEFNSNGAVSTGVSTVLETDLPDARVERWTVTTSVAGLSKAERTRH
jgi:Tfp pilus assembly protein FimT